MSAVGGDILFRLGALSAALAVIAGAFGAHGATGAAADWLRTGAFYQLIHGVAVIALAHRGRDRPAWLMLGGAALFAGTLYAMALGAPRMLGAVTPLGGLAMIAAWLWLAVARSGGSPR